MLSQQELAEQERIKALCALNLLDTPAEDRFDRFTRIAASAFNVPIALVSLIDCERQWFKSRVGMDTCETPRDMAFCSHAMALDDMLVVPDTHLDERFVHNALVLGEPGIRFYAGQPVHSVDGQPLGTLCIIDRVPRAFGDGERRMLRDLGQLVETEINRDVLVQARDAAQQALRDVNVALERRVEARTRDLHFSEARVRTIIDRTISAFVGIDDGGRVQEWNPAAQNLFGWTPAEIVGREFSALIVPERHRAAHEAGFARFLQTGEATVLDRLMELPVLTRDGTERTVEMTINAFRIDGRLCVNAFMLDISERAAAREALRQKQVLLDAVLESVDVGVVACNAEGAITVFNRATRELCGLDPDAATPSRRDIDYQLCADDGVTPLTADAVPLLRALRGETVDDMPMVIRPSEGPPRHVLGSGRALKGSGGEPLGAVVALKDVTELMDSRARVVESEEWLRTIADNVPALIAYVDTGLRYRFANLRYQEWFGVPCKAMLGKTVLEAMGEEFFAPRRVALESCLAGNASHVEIEEERRGRRRVISACYLPHVRDGAVQGAYVLATDATSAREYERQLHTLAHSDHLTGLPNRRSYEDRLAQAVSRAKRGAQALALAYLDIDHFKHINDTLGHAVGDGVLCEFSRRLSGAVRISDTVARLAGDEFVILLEQVGSPLECERIAAKLLEAIRAPFIVGNHTLRVSASIGIVWSPHPDAGTLTQGADAALYRSKDAGRDSATVTVVDGTR
jgi:diguanylate cyclase (GGDEF)-like protein/PAS domain S-box-containing protein